MIEEFPHVLVYYNFSRKKDRYFLSPYEVEISTHGSQRTVCDIIHSSDFLCGLFDIDRLTIIKQMSSNITSTGSTTTDNSPSPNIDEKLTRRALSCSSSPTNDTLLTMIEQKLDFKHRCMFYSTGPTSDLCVCALDVDYNSAILCNDIGYSNLITYDESTTLNSSNEEDNSQRAPTKYAHKMRHQHRQYVHQWICIRDIIDGLITCNHTLKSKSIMEILSKMDLWVKQRNEPKTIQLKPSKSDSSTNVKLFKARARQLVWDLMEMKNEVRFPRPAHGRIPNFRYCEVAAENVTGLECFKRARVVKINPSLAQEPIRYLTLAYNKVLLTPTPSLDSALFYKLEPKFLRRNQLEWAATKTGAAELGSVIQLQALKQIHVDLIIVASVVVNPITGARIGKGKGYADLEYAIMSQMGCVSNKTIIMTICHESQLINDIPNNIMEQHDLPVDIIVTPKRYIYTKRSFERPTRVYWNKLDPNMMISIPVLQELKRLEEQNIIKSQ
jgi:5-formyltetrahydrofolate cyclo-ligase